MASSPRSQVTELLERVRDGQDGAREELLRLVYPELRRIAANAMRGERPNHTLRTTGLVNETYLRLFGRETPEFANRAHFFSTVAREMRRILVEHARSRNALRRPDGRVRLSLEDIEIPAPERGTDLVALDQALERFEAVDARAAQVVELRFFGGLTEDEAAATLGVSLATLKRDWTFARAWLFDQLAAS
jgi:RNA polymerase sigma factor (TIGR02999 family)